MGLRHRVVGAPRPSRLDAYNSSSSASPLRHCMISTKWTMSFQRRRRLRQLHSTSATCPTKPKSPRTAASAGSGPAHNKLLRQQQSLRKHRQRWRTGSATLRHDNRRRLFGACAKRPHDSNSSPTATADTPHSHKKRVYRAFIMLRSKLRSYNTCCVKRYAGVSLRCSASNRRIIAR